MNRTRQWKSVVVAAACLCVLNTLSLAAEPRHCLTRHLRSAVVNRRAKRVGNMPANQPMTLNVVLPLRDQTGLRSLLTSLYNPASPSYRHFLTVEQFTARFGPSEKEYNSVSKFLRKRRFSIVGGSRDGMNVVIKGPVSAVDKTFNVKICRYRHATEDRDFYAPDREPTVDLPYQLWHISGLDNYSIPKPRLITRSAFAKAHGMNPNAVVTHATTGSGPSGAFLGSDMRAAYYGGTALTGAGQNLGLFEYAGTDLDDLATYYKNVGQTNKVPVTLVSTDGTSTACLQSAGCDDSEQTIDMTQALGMAPGLASLVVYVGSTDTAIISAMTTHNPLPTTIGCSWGWTPADPNTLDPYFQKMAAQGQTFFAASGDNSTWSSSNEAWPADDANVVSVGGTDLITAKAAGAWQSETAWVNSGGGVSPDSIPIPSWQQLPGVINSNNRGSTTLRNGPDVSANANFTFYVCADQTACAANQLGGTSFAAPMWAGYLALVNQQAAANGSSPAGFINPAIYSQNLTSRYATDFHDITSGTSGSFSAAAGYDLVTGWGSPRGTGLINSLTPATTASDFSISASTQSEFITVGRTGSAILMVGFASGFSAPVTLSAVGQPVGVNISFSPGAIIEPGAAHMILSVSRKANTGTYPVTITATGAGIAHSITLNFTVRR